jgi:hypothetical protein
MADEINGTSVIIQKGSPAAEIVGQAEITHTIGGTPIDISNKSAGDNILLLDGEVSSQQHVFSGTCVYNSDTEFQAMLTESLTCTQDDYTITYPGTTPVTFTGKFAPSGVAIASPHGDKVTATFTLSSSGAVTKS